MFGRYFLSILVSSLLTLLLSSAFPSSPLQIQSEAWTPDATGFPLRAGHFHLDRLHNFVSPSNASQETLSQGDASPLISSADSQRHAHLLAQLQTLDMHPDVHQQYAFIARITTDQQQPTSFTCTSCEYLGRGHYLVHMDAPGVASLAHDPRIDQLVPYGPAMKLTLPLQQTLSELTYDQQTNRTVSTNVFFNTFHHDSTALHSSESKAQITSLIEQYTTEMRAILDALLPQTSVNFTFQHATHRAVRLDVTHPDAITLNALLAYLAAQPDILLLDTHQTLHILNDISTAIVQSGASFVRPLNGDLLSSPITHAPLTGADEVVGLADTGLDYGHCFFRPASSNYVPPFYSASALPPTPPPPPLEDVRVLAYLYWSESDRFDSIGGHGTHTSGSLVGHPQNTALYSGMHASAYQARIVFFDVQMNDPSRFPLSGEIAIPADLTLLFDALYQMGARIQSHSWGMTSTAYDAFSAQADQFARQRDDALLVFAAGNSGGQGSAQPSLSEPGLSKNSLQVGASVGAEAPQWALELSSRQRLTAFLATANFGRILNGSAAVESTRIAVLSSGNAQGCSAYSAAEQTFAAGSILLLDAAGTQCAPLTQATRAAAAGALAVVIAAPLSQVVEGAWVFAMSTGHADAVDLPVFFVSDGERDALHTLLDVDVQHGGVAMNVVQSVLRRPLSSSEIDNLAYFSSRGPAPARRIKPDVVAPGAVVFSAMANDMGLPGSTQCSVVPAQGTSMATPVSASGITLMREYLRRGYYPSGEPRGEHVMANPSGALLKAMAVHSARRMPGITWDDPNDTVDLRRETYPYIYQGHGRLNISNVLYFANDTTAGNMSLALYDRETITAGTHSNRSLTVNEVGLELVVTLVWMDGVSLSGSEGSGVIQQLALEIVSPNGTRFYGNARSQLDTDNNVQKVIFFTEESGNYQVVVHGVSTPLGEQTYALVTTVRQVPCNYLCTNGQSLEGRGGLSAGAWIGIAFGILGALLLIALIVWGIVHAVHARKKRKTASMSNLNSNATPYYYTTVGGPPQVIYGAPPAYNQAYVVPAGAYSQGSWQ